MKKHVQGNLPPRPSGQALSPRSDASSTACSSESADREFRRALVLRLRKVTPARRKMLRAHLLAMQAEG